MNKYVTLDWRSACRPLMARPAMLPLLVTLLFATGCSIDDPFVRSSLDKAPREKNTAVTEFSAEALEAQKPRATSFYQTPKAPANARNVAGKPPASQIANKDETGESVASLQLENMPLPQFVTAVFGGILKLNVSMDPAVAQRTDMVSLRSGKPQTEAQIFAAARAVLRSYGLAVNEFNGLVRITPESGQSGYLPEIRRGRAAPDVPEGLRPVFYLAELQHTNVAQASTWLRTLFQGRVTVTDDPSRNALMLNGQTDAVNAALEALQLLDQPMMRGKMSARIVPVFWSADEMAKRLVEMLGAEGYAASQNAMAQSPILVLPIAALNSVIVFAGSQEVLNHTLQWAQELDQTSPSRQGGGYITYHVRNTDAADLASTLKEVMGESVTKAAPVATPSAAGASGSAAPAPAAVSASGSKVVVNKQANSIIIKTTPTEYQQWYALLQELDRPARTALIMATVAEVSIDKTDNLGFNWVLKQFTAGGFQVDAGTVGKVAAGSAASGMHIALARGGDPRALLTAISSNNRTKILANPSIMTRNGETATIQVGDEVPIVTSQTSSATASSATSTGVVQMQTVQYRSTGTILRVKPVIHSGGRVEIDVSQEVSAVKDTATGAAVSSPTVSTRKIDTKLTVSEGNTILLGGLISSTTGKNISGIPLLKDIPYVGSLFRTEDKNTDNRTELIVMLTPYIVEDDFDARAVTDAFRNQFAWAREMTLPSAAAGKALPAPTADGGAAVDLPAEQKAPSVPATDAPKASPVPEPPRRSKPYVLPEVDQTATVPAPTVAPAQQSAGGPSAELSPQNPAVVAPVVDSPSVPGVQQNAGSAQPVTDEALKRELLKTIQDAAGGANN